MQFLCTQTCQIRIAGKIHFVEAGEVRSLPANPYEKCFISLEDPAYSVDFGVASRQELLQAKWKLSEAQAAMQELFGEELIKHEGDKKADLVERILDIRFRAVTDA